MENKIGVVKTFSKTLANTWRKTQWSDITVATRINSRKQGTFNLLRRKPTILRS